MENDLDKNWKKQAKRFRIFKPKKENIKPSEWMIVLFMIHKIFGGLRKKRIFRPTAEKSQERGSIGNMTANVTNWPDLPLPWEAVQQNKTEQNSTAKAAETTKKSSIRGGFARISMVFRRGALSPPRSTDV